MQGIITAPVAIALGSNLGDRISVIQKALELLAAKVTVSTIAPFYESRPVGFSAQGNFINTALIGVTELSPQELLRFIKNIETSLGRVERFQNGPREIDLDIIFYDDLTFEELELTIPHPRAHERDFVLAPLADIRPAFTHPVLKKSVAELLHALPPESRSVIGMVSFLE